MAIVKARKRTSRKRLRNALFAFPLAAVALLSHTPRARADYTTGATAPYNTSISSNERRAIEIILALEGGWNPHDNGSVSNYGILASAHGFTDQQDHDITKYEAIGIYDKDYWHQVHGIDQMPFAMQVVALNAAVNINPTQANIMDATAHNDYHVVMRETQDWYNQLDAENDELYGPDMPGWAARQRKIVSFIRDDLPDVAPDTSSAESRLAAVKPEIKINRVIPEQASFLPEANAATMVPPTAPEVAKAAPKEMPPTGEEMETAATGMAGDTLWAAMLAPLIALWRRLFKRRRRPSHNYRPDEKPMHVTVDGVRPEVASPDAGLRAAKGYASGEQRTGSPLPQFNPTHLDGFSELERAAFVKTFAHHFANSPSQPQRQWQIHYDDKSHVMIEPQRVTLFGDKGIEETLLYAANAWGGCKISDATPEYCDNMARIAQRLISEGKLPKNFVMEGVPSFAAEPAVAPQPAAQESSPLRPKSAGPQPIGWFNRSVPA